MLCAALPATRAAANPLDAIASFFGIGQTAPAADPAPATVVGTSVVDTSSHGDWSDVVDSTTENIGRIWTDKSVYDEDVTLPGVDDQTSGPVIERDGSQFLVGLSALSSMSNITTTTSTPLDIVLVLDTSGSMADPGRAVYADSLDKSKTYYQRVPVLNVYRAITWSESEQSWGHKTILGGWQKVTPKANESDARGTQLYLNGSRLDDLKAAAKDFVTKTREANASIENRGDRHRIALVTFSTGAVLRSGLGVVDDAHSSDLNDLLNGLDAEGATEADNGFSTAKEELANARQGAQKAVIFFTDGAPGQSGFDGNAANRAVKTALEMKNADTLVYSVGVFDGADPDSASNSNQFMNAVSSNYRNATAYDNLGDRVPETENYYLTTSEGQSLSEIFNKIFEEVTSGTGSPTEIETGHPSDESGYITFTDKLGAYMQVDNFKSVLFADQLFENPTEKTEGNATTYTFSGTVADSDLYPNAEMKDLLITVQHSDNVAEGDTVTVRIPASLIPLRKFQMYPEGEKTSTVTNTWPLRIYFGVSPKGEVAGLLANPDEAMNKYIAANRNADTGTVSFYTNDYTTNDPGKTIANFTPAENNSYYYFTENTPIYTSDVCDARVTGALNENSTYWYQRKYYSIEAGKVVEKTAKYSFKGNSAIALSGAVGYDAAGAYLKKGSPRVTYIDELRKLKGDNKTGTGTDVINPDWNNEDSVENATQINVRLGNNGRLDVELPGVLAVNKTVKVPAGYEPDVFENTDFTFNITLTDAQGVAVSGKYAAAIKGAQGVVNKIKDGVTFDGQGKASQAIKPGETLYVYGLAKGTQYKVVENQLDGFEVDPSDATGSIVAGEVTTANFTNTYKPSPVTLADGVFRAQKNLDGRSWQENDSFELRLRAEGDAPMPEGSKLEDNILYKAVTVTNKSAGNDQSKDPVTFGEIKYTAPGEYQYTIHEEAPTNRIPGVTYTDAIYRVWVTVQDANLDGKLDEPTVVMKQTYDDNGDEIKNPEVTKNNVAAFTNMYSVDGIQAAPQGVKTLTGTTQQLGSDPFKFKFKVTVKQGDTPVPTAVDSSGRMDEGKFYEVGHAPNGNITFGLAAFDARDLKKTYIYQVEEVIPAAAVNKDGVKFEDREAKQAQGPWKLNGVTYDDNVWLAQVTLNDKTVDGKQVLDPVWTYEAQGSSGASTASQIVFNNTYAADPVTLTDDNVIKGSKTLEGRNFKENETFGFTIQAHDRSTEAAINGGFIENLEGLNAPVVVDGNTPDGAFNFGKATFSKAGTYKFDVYESHWNGEPIQGDMQDKKGMTFDSSMYVVTVKVTDNVEAGRLEAKTTYVRDGQPTTQAEFVNTYSASESFGDLANGGITVGKTLNGRNMDNGEFGFTVTAAVGAPDAAEAKSKLDKLPDTDRAFSNQRYAAGQKWTTKKLGGLAFSNADAGKTFSYIVDEVEPAADAAKPGVTYDKSEFRVDLTVSDDGDGNLSVDTKITRVKNTAGTEVNESTTEIAFVNEYKPEKVDVDLGVEGRLYKRLNGRDWKEADEFTFQVTAKNGAPTPNGTKSPYEVKLSGAGHTYKNGEDVPFNIGTISFDSAGTYTYEVKELGGVIPGITYDTKWAATVAVRVEDNAATGKLEVAEVSVRNPRVVNTYSAEVNYANAVNFKLTKQLTGGKKMEANQFTFTITAKDKQSADKFTGELVDGKAVEFTGPSQAAIDAAGEGDTVDMPSAVDTPLIFTQADSDKTFSYTFAEVDKKQTGYTYDKTSYQLEITPYDNGDGTMDITTTVTTFEDGKQQGEHQKYEAKAGQLDDQKPSVILPFVNEYKAVAFEGVPASLTFTKVLKGKSWEGDTFEFTMTGIDGTNTAGQSSAAMVDRSNGTVTDQGGTHDSASFGFGELEFTEPGEYKYQVAEVVPADAVNKQGKRYEDATSEEQSKGPWMLHGVQYDTHKANVTITVSDLKGSLVASATIENGVFTNEYMAQLNYGQVGGLSITKTLNGRNMRVDQFSFTVTPGNDASAKLIGLGSASEKSTLTSPAANAGVKASLGKVFDGIAFTQDNIGDAYTYTISENNADSLGAGYACTGSSSFDIEISVADAGEGKLKVTTKVKGDKESAATECVYETGSTSATPASVDFVNTYTAAPSVLGGDGSVKIDAIKTLTGRDMAAGEFGFEIRNISNGKNIPVSEGTNAAAADGKAGAVTFEPIKYTSESLVNDIAEGNVVYAQNGDLSDTYTYTYSVREVTGFGNDTGVTQGAAAFTVEVVVKDDNQGKISIESIGYPDGGKLAFTNFYGASAEKEISLNGFKEYRTPTGAGYHAPDIEGKYYFTIKGLDGAPMPDGSANGEKTVSNVNRNVDFGTVRYTMENVFGPDVTTTDAADTDAAGRSSAQVREKTFTYQVTESGTVDHVVNDPNSTREFKVTVTDDGKGGIDVKTDPAQDHLFTFTNTYKVDSGSSSLTGDGGFKISKSITGRDLVADEFEFVLTDANGKVVATAKNDANGSVQMPNVTFDVPGSYLYTLSEVAGDAGGVTYDGKVYNVTAEVKDAGGALEVIWSVGGAKPGDTLTFANEYKADPLRINFRAAKVLKGRDLKEGEFEFVLSEGGKKLCTAKNDADGGVMFDAIEYTEPGTHTYEIAEVKGDLDGVTYDETVHTVTVSVSDDGKGNLTFTHEFGETGEPVFVNTYKKASDPAPDVPGADGKQDGLPRTGDMSALLVVPLLAGAGMVLAGERIRRQRNSR